MIINPIIDKNYVYIKIYMESLHIIHLSDINAYEALNDIIKLSLKIIKYTV